METNKQISSVNNSADEPTHYHTPVLLKETVDGLNIDPAGIYVDCTFGGGGHAKAILQQLNDQGKIFVFDQDADAAVNKPEDGRMTFIPQNFRNLQRFLRLHKVTQVNGILADLGVSSHQFDKADRGFSTRFDASLDMRMDQRQTNTAATLLSNYSEQQLHKMFELYGEVTNAKTLARTIVEKRTVAPLRTISEFKSAVHSIVKGNPQKYFAQVFQALRIAVNDEFGALQELLQQTPSLLIPGGRIAIISFHSLEDRLVKNFFRSGTFTEAASDDVYGTRTEGPFNILTKKPITASEKELKTNSRSRSARLRIAEKK